MGLFDKITPKNKKLEFSDDVKRAVELPAPPKPGQGPKPVDITQFRTPDDNTPSENNSDNTVDLAPLEGTDPTDAYLKGAAGTSDIGKLPKVPEPDSPPEESTLIGVPKTVPNTGSPESTMIGLPKKESTMIGAPKADTITEVPDKSSDLTMPQDLAPPTDSSLESEPKLSDLKLPEIHDSKELPHFDSGSPKELPDFPMQQEEEDIPMPPPNLRSEISPLELEKLEEKYLYTEPEIASIDSEEKYNRHIRIKRPLMIRTDYYKEMLDAFTSIQDTLKLGEEIVFRLGNLKKNSDVEFENYKKTIEDIQRKLIYIDKSVFEGA